MRKSVLLLTLTAVFGMAVTLSAQVVVVAGFDRFNDPFTNQVTSAAVALSGVSATLTVSGTGNSDWFRNNTGSNDGTFGPTLTGADNTNTTSFYGSLTTAAVNDQSGFYLDIGLTNNSGTDIELESVAFDAWRDFGGSPPRWDLWVVSGGLTNGYVGQTGFISEKNSLPAVDNANDYTDLIMTGLGGLADNILGDGESAVLRLQIWESSFTLGTAGKMSIDNIAVTGVVVPEPSTYALLSGIAVFGLVVLRRRLQKK